MSNLEYLGRPWGDISIAGAAGGAARVQRGRMPPRIADERAQLERRHRHRVARLEVDRLSRKAAKTPS